VGVLRDNLDLSQALVRLKTDAAAWLPNSLNDSFRLRLRREVDAGPFRPMRGAFGKVRMEIEGYDVAAPMDGFPLMRELSHELGALVRSSGAPIRGLATWTPNEIGVTRYRPGSLGITPHLDGKWYRRLVAVITVYGRSRFAICRSREGDVMADWRPGPGDLVLMRAPGLGGLRDGRPFHLAEGPTKGMRCSLGVRMSVKRPSG
jgi:alkylated DNA repair dioxygenase AlkB